VNSDSRPARRVPRGAACPRRYLPVSSPFASGKYGKTPTPRCTHDGMTSRSASQCSRL
jgi:hypothetical protein